MSVAVPDPSLIPGQQDEVPPEGGVIEAKQSKFHQWRNYIQDVCNQNTGLLLVVSAMVFWSMEDTAVVKLHRIDPPVPTLQLILVRMGITFILCMSYMFIAKIPDPVFGPKGVRLLLLARGFGGFLVLFGIYFSLQYLSLSDATVLTFLSPICTAIAGAIFLGESFVIRQAVAGFISLAGVVLIARPTAIFGDSSHPHNLPNNVSAGERLLAVGVSLIGVLGATLAFVSIRAIGSRAHALHVMSYFSTLCVFVSAIGMIITNTELVIPTQLNWLALLLMIGVFGFLAQLLLTMGLQRESAGRGTLAVYTQIVFATILEFLFFHTVPPLLSILGIFMIVCSALYTALTKQKGQESPENKLSTGPIRLRRSEDEELERGLISASLAQSTGDE